MATKLILPSLGYDMTEGKVSAWRKAEGDRVAKGDVVLEVETEKANVEVEAPTDGILARIAVPAGSTVPVGTVVGILAAEGEALPPGEATSPARAAPAPPAKAPPAPGAPLPPAGSAAEGAEGERVKASPLARRMAREAGIDLAAVRGTGDGGRVTERDVQGAIDARVGGDAELVPLSPMRRAIARRMAASKGPVPHFYAAVDVPVAAALALRRASGAPSGEGEHHSLNDIVVAAVARTLPRFPLLNASFRGDGVELHRRVCIGIAVAVEEGLVVPVLHDADRKGLDEISRKARGLVARAREGRLRAEELGPATFSVTNLSAYGVDEFTAIIDPPLSAILAVGAVVRRPVAVGDGVRIEPMVRFTLSVDHRVADGAVAGRFLQELRRLLGHPEELPA